MTTWTMEIVLENDPDGAAAGVGVGEEPGETPENDNEGG